MREIAYAWPAWDGRRFEDGAELAARMKLTAKATVDKFNAAVAAEAIRLSNSSTTQGEAMPKSNTNVRHPRDSQNEDGSINQAKLEEDAAHAFEQFRSGTETMLSLHRQELPDGSVIDSFHHKAA